MVGKYHVTIDGQGFLLRSGSYRRTASAPTSSPAAYNSSLSGGWRQWHQSDWRGGDGYRVSGVGGQESGGRWRSGYGVEVGEPGRVRLGPSLSASLAAASESGFASMLSLGARLFAASSSSGRVYALEGSVWNFSTDTGRSSLRSLARHGNRIYLGSGSDGTVWWSEGEGWTPAFTAPGASAIGSISSYGVWNAAAGSTVSRLFVGAEYPTGEARLLSWDGSTLAEIQGCQESRIEAMAVYGGRLYVATSEAGSAVQGRLLCYDGRSASGEWLEVTRLSDNYVAGLALFDNLLFCGSGLGGKLWAFDGSRMVEGYSLSAPGLDYSQPLRALAVCGGRLYAGYCHPTEGASLLCKLPAQGLEVGGQGSGVAGPYPPTPNPRVGWFTPSTIATAAVPQAAMVHDGQLYLGCGETGAGTIYRLDTISYRPGGLLETSFFDGSQPGVRKLLRSLTVGHEKLLAGQWLEVRFALEGSDTFQQIEEFDSLAGCERPLTTADWRPGNSLARLKGMSAQGFAGKTQGRLAVPHVARKILSTNPESPPATFSEEFGDDEYAAVSAAGGGVAIATNPVEGGYAHQLFEFDLAGLNPVGLRPRAICYGKGDYFGSIARGVNFRMWNHLTGAWDLVGSNEAAPEESVVARTIEATVAGFGCYVSVTGKLYLSLCSAYAGSATNPSEVGADLVELGALWQSSGDVVSEPLRLPVVEPVTGATLTLLASKVPAGTGLEIYMSADDGEHWEAVESSAQHSFAHTGSSLRWKARLTSQDGLDTPRIERLKVDYVTGSWMLLGRSDTEGSTSTVLAFENGVAARQVAFRIEMGSGDPSGSPALTSIALQYASQPETRRRWEMEAICEGVSGAPLRLLDGSTEARTGRELSQLLWQAKARGASSFEDVDGSSYQVWFEELEERLSNTAQERGPQTVAKCRLVEC